MRPVNHIVDDESDAADSLGTSLSLHTSEAKVSVRNSGPTGLTLAQQQRPDAAVLDLELPGLDGGMLARILQTSCPTSTPLLIALSGNVLRLSALEGSGLFDHR